MPIESPGSDFNIDIPSWVNQPHGKTDAARKNINKNRQTTASHVTSPQRSRSVSHSTPGQKRSPIDRTLDYDTLELSRTRRSHGKKKKSGAGVRAGALLTAVVSLCGVGLARCDEDKPTTDPIPVVSIEQPYSQDSIDSEIIIESETPNYEEADEIVSLPKNLTGAGEIEDIKEIEQTQSKEDKEAEKLLKKFEKTGGDAWDEFDVLCDVFGLNKKEMAKKLIYLCEDEEWGKNYVDPILLCAQMYQESSYQANQVGDNGEAIGLGQIHKCAVDDVNRVFDTNYKYSDRSNPEKALEMMILYSRYCHVQAGSTNGMLAMYNAGHKDAIEHQYGKEYVKKVYSRINQTPNFN